MSAQKTKGDRYERELAAYLSEQLGLDCQRLLASARADHSGLHDLDGIPGLAIEAKRVERLNFRAAWRQARRNAAADTVPAVITRQSRQRTGESLVVISLDDFLPMLRTHLSRDDAPRPEPAERPPQRTEPQPALPF